MSFRFRHAICNEVYKGWDFRQACQSIKKAGYSGIEIAPFTLADDPCTITPAARRETRAIMADEGLEFVGLHWLMVSPAGLHVTTPDHALRARSWRHIHDLIDLCADLGPNGVMIFGSPKQRTSTGGATPAEAAHVWRLVMEYESHGNPTISAVARPLLFGTWEADSSKVRDGLPALYAELDLLAERVAAGSMVGSTLSAADIVWFCGLQQLVRASTRPAAAAFDLGVWPLNARWPAIVAWARRIEAIPGFDATRPPHWAEGAHPSPARIV